MLCHSPQERLFIDGGWHDGLLPPVEALPAAERATTLAEYRALRRRRRGRGRRRRASRSRPRARAGAIRSPRSTRVTFAAWLDAQGLAAPALRWYLDYCCRDDYGAGSADVSAWAGLHYFASRHGFHAPGDDAQRRRSEARAHLARRQRLARASASPRRSAIACIRAASSSRVDEGRARGRRRRLERGDASSASAGPRARVVLATPLFVAARLLAAPPAALRDAAGRVRHAPWLVANLQLDAAARRSPRRARRRGTTCSTAARGLGYVDAMHQSTRAVAGPTVLTRLRRRSAPAATRRSPSSAAACSPTTGGRGPRRVIADLAPAHPDLAAKLRRVDLMRYGHAMSIPVPGVRSSAALRALAAPQRRVHFAHADLVGVLGLRGGLLPRHARRPRRGRPAVQ